ncbi:hypothetical protein ACFL5Q_04995 [Planctomycetota bacterium]
MDTEQQRVERALNEARAKIIWGDSVDEVRERLEDWGVSSEQIDELLATTLQERAVEFRKRGIVELVIGAAVLVPPLLIVGAMYLSGVVVSRLALFLALLCYAVALYGLYRCARGVWWLFRGAKSEGSLTQE